MNKLLITLGILTLLTSSCGKFDKAVLIPGPKGDTGLQGQPGTSCTQSKVQASAIAGDPAQYGGSLITCLNGSQLIANGSPGAQGQTGPQGATGQPGLSAKAVQLCPNGPPTVYGSVEEVGFCLQNSLYVLFQNSGTTDLILGQLLPGSYQDHNGNLGCNFQVLANCGVL